MKITRRSNRILIALAIVLIVAAGCARHQENKAGAPEFHRIKGLVLAVDSSRNRLVIAHEEIPHYMKAMTMAFVVKDTSLLRGVEVGDSVIGVVARRQSEVWIDSITVFHSEPPSKDHH